MSNVITSKVHRHVEVWFFRKRVILQGAKPGKGIYGRKEKIAGFRAWVKNDDEIRGAIRQWIKFNGSPLYAYEADVRYLGSDRMKSRERLDGADRRGNNQGEVNEWGDAIK